MFEKDDQRERQIDLHNAMRPTCEAGMKYMEIRG